VDVDNDAIPFFQASSIVIHPLATRGVCSDKNNSARPPDNWSRLTSDRVIALTRDLPNRCQRRVSCPEHAGISDCDAPVIRLVIKLKNAFLAIAGLLSIRYRFVRFFLSTTRAAPSRAPFPDSSQHPQGLWPAGRCWIFALCRNLAATLPVHPAGTTGS
jgi:hypothetical protein